MESASEALIGNHDFRGYTEELDPTVENTRRKIFSVDVVKRGEPYLIDVVTQPR